MARPITLAIAGDVMLGRLVDQIIAKHGFAYPWGDMLPTLHQADRFLINLECALTARTERWHDGAYKAFYFRADPAAVEALKLARVDVASLANNHTADFGFAGLVETVERLDQAGIAHAGAGRDLAAAQAPARLTADGGRISVLAFADYPEEWAATRTSPGINHTPISLAPEDFGRVEQAIAGERQRADLIIFSIHWGPNMRSRPTPSFREFARRVVEVGADIFWGHSAHIVQGVEVWQGKLILYDTGDFVDDYAVDPVERNDLSALFLVRLCPPTIERLELVPVHIDHMQVHHATGAEREWFARRFTTLCRELGTDVSEEAGRLVVRVR